MLPLSSLVPTRTLASRADAALPSTEAEIAAVFAPMGTAPLAFMYCQVPIDTFFAGVLTMQVYSYFKYQKNDNWWIKSVVISAAFINAGFTVYLWVFMQYLFVENFGKWSPFAETRWLAGGPFVDSINSGIIQAFFAYRAYRLCNRMWIIPLVCGILIVTSIGATMAVLIMFSSFQSLFQADQVAVPELIWLSSIMAADIIITVSIIYGLLRSKTGWSHTDKIIVRLIRMTLESQLPPTVVALTFVIEFVRTPSSLFGATMQGIQPKFYAMGLMYALNARVTFQQKWVGDNDRTGPVFAMSDRPTQKTQLQTALEVEVETQTYVQSSAKNEYDRAFDRPGVNRGVYEVEEDKKESDWITDQPQVRFNSQARLTDPQNN